MTSRVLIFLTTIVLGGCFGSSQSSQESQLAPAIAPIRVPAKVQAKPSSARDPELLRLVRIANQADQIQREAWWVVSGERKSALRSPFGKLQRAALSGLDERLASKGIFHCDRYVLQKGPPSERWSATFFENCEPRSAPKEIAMWTLTAVQRGRAEFTPGNLGEVLGMGASIFGRRLSCEISWDEKDVIEEMNCPNWEQDRESQIVRLETFEYHRQKGKILKLKGKILENLTAIRQIETEVPLDGKITVVETELRQRPGTELRSALEKPLLPGSAKNQKVGAGATKPAALNPLAPPRGAPLDPDLPKAPGELNAQGIPMKPAAKVFVPPPGGVRVPTPEEMEAAEQQRMEQQMPVQVAPGMVLMPGGIVPNMPIPTANGMLIPIQVPPQQQGEMAPEESQGIQMVPPIAPPNGVAPPAINPNSPAVPIAPLPEPNYIPADQPGR